MDTQPQLPDGNGGPPTLAVAGSIKTRCPHCQHDDYWTLVGEQYVCSQCGNFAIVVAATGETIDQAIAAVAQELPERVEPVQGTIPGLQPKFDEHGALDIIEECERVASEAERAHSAASERAKRLRKDADDANADLRKAIRDLNKRRHDARYEPAPTDGPDDGDASSGMRPADSEDRQPEGQGPTASVVGLASEDAALTAAPLNETAERHSSDASLLTGRAHVINATLDGCVVCGIGFTPYPEHQAGDPFGINCTGYPEDRPEWLQERLADAGADKVTLEQIALWTPEQRVTARLWAEEQIEAHQQDEPGKQTSIAWPEHVSLAHHGPEYGKYTRRHPGSAKRRRGDGAND